ncbi:MAG: acetyl-CoA carboxylase biotin carboxyl carrier protein subunit [Actinotalea sp.]|nr:acetyl-CoA carboxylase biotin carboxyl carrier protein subunit [Actinotalea sp.]
MDLSHDDVLQILELIDAADAEHVELRVGGTVIVVDRSAGSRPVGDAPATSAVAQTAPSAPSADPGALGPGPADASGTPGGSETGSTAGREAADSDLVDVLAPMVGIFYSAPTPGASPFTRLGATVEAGATVGLVEVMKMFTGVTAHTAGTVTEVLAVDGDFVEYGQTLLRIRPGSA